MDALTAYGAAAVALMLVFYALESRRATFVLWFAAACLASSVYGFLSGAWPFGVVEMAWAGVAVRRWRTRVSHTERAEGAEGSMACAARTARPRGAGMCGS